MKSALLAIYILVCFIFLDSDEIVLPRKTYPISKQNSNHLRVFSLIKHKIPKIAILAFQDKNNNSLYKIDSTYVNWIHSGGGVAIPILPWMNTEKLDEILTYSDGILFPHVEYSYFSNDSTSFENSYVKSAYETYKKIKAFNSNEKNYLPLLGIGSGCDMLQLFAADNRTDIMVDFLKKGNEIGISTTSGDFIDLHSLSLLTSQPRTVRMLHFFDGRDINNIQHKKVLPRYHSLGINPNAYSKINSLNQMFKVIGIGQYEKLEEKKRIAQLKLNITENIFQYVSMIEAYRYPFYGVSFDPAKYIYGKFNIDNENDEILEYSNQAVTISQKILNFFIREAYENLYRKVFNHVYKNSTATTLFEESLTSQKIFEGMDFPQNLCTDTCSSEKNYYDGMYYIYPKPIENPSTIMINNLNLTQNTTNITELNITVHPQTIPESQSQTQSTPDPGPKQPPPVSQTPVELKPEPISQQKTNSTEIQSSGSDGSVIKKKKKKKKPKNNNLLRSSKSNENDD